MRAAAQSVSQGHVPLSRQLVMIVKILFSLITVIIPQKLYKVHSILRGGGDRRRGGPFGLEASPVDSNKGNPAGLGDMGVEVRL